MSEIKTLYIVGPTASGKTALSIELAKELNGEIICADSQTIRRDMNIGTAKPLAKEMQGIRHHMLDIIDPYEGDTLEIVQKMAKKVISEIHSRNKPAIIVGGTGLYVDALYQNFTLPTLAKHLAGSNPATRSDPATGLDLVVCAEPASPPALTANLRTALSWLLTLARNKITQTSTTTLVRNDADSGTIGTSTVSDDGTTFIRGKYS